MHSLRPLSVCTGFLLLATLLPAQGILATQGQLAPFPLLQPSAQAAFVSTEAPMAIDDPEVNETTGSGNFEPAVIAVTPRSEHKPRIHWHSLLAEEFFDISASHVDRILHEPFTRAQLQGHVFQDWKTIVKNWEWSHWNDGDRDFTTYIGHSSQGNLAGWIYRNNDDDGGIEQNFHDPRYRRIIRNSFLVETAYAWQWKLGPLSEATIGHVGLHYDPVRHTNRSGMDDLIMDEVGGTIMMVGEDWLDKHIMRPYERHHHGHVSTDILRMFLGLNQTYANMLSFRKPWYRQGRE
jgi:hypothetical protein